MEKKSSLPPSIQPFIWTRPQDPQGLSPTASSPGAQDEPPELPGPLYAPPPRQSPFPVLPPLPAVFPDTTRRQYPGYDTGAAHAPGGLAAPERLAGPSYIPHGFAGRHRSPVASDPPYPAGRPQGSAAAYSGSLSLPGLSQITSDAWREGEAGPSSLVHSQPYGSGSRRPSPAYLQPIHRRATSPWPYSIAERTEAPRLHGSYEYLPSLFPEPPRLPPLYARPQEGISGYGARTAEQGAAPPIFSLPPHLSAGLFDHTTAGDDGRNPRKRKQPPDSDDLPRRRVAPRKISVACEFCRARKLKCDGNRPACSNCLSRFKDDCKYEKEVKRRGPGKAAKGSRAQKPKARHSEPTGRLDDFDAQTIAPSLRPRASLPRSMYSSQNTLVESRYDSPEPEPVEPESRQPPTKKRRRKTTKREPSSEYYPENETKH